MNAPIRPLRLLMSQPSIDQLGPAISALMGPRPHELLALDTAVATQRTDADVAFISREVTGTSTKHQIHPALQQVYDLLRQSPGLKWVHIHSAGADRQIYLDLKARGVQIATSSGANAQVVATVALAGLLALARRFPGLWAEQQARQWIPLLGERMPRDLPGQTATLVGWGPIGQKLGSLLQALGLHVVAVRQHAATPWQATPDAVEHVLLGIEIDQSLGANDRFGQVARLTFLPSGEPSDVAILVRPVPPNRRAAAPSPVTARKCRRVTEPRFRRMNSAMKPSAFISGDVFCSSTTALDPLPVSRSRSSPQTS